MQFRHVYTINKNLDAQIVKIDISNGKTIDYQDTINVKIDVAVYKPGLQIYLVFLVRNSIGENIIFWRDFEANKTLSKVRSKGNYRYSISIPQYSLAPGKYALEAAIGDTSRPTDVDKPLQYPTFEILDNLSIRNALHLPWRSITGIHVKMDINFNGEPLTKSNKERRI